MAPAFEFSAITSKPGARRSTRSRPAGALRSIAMERLPRLLRRKVAPDVASLGVDHRRLGAASEVAARGFSTFTTSAPRRASSWVA